MRLAAVTLVILLIVKYRNMRLFLLLFTFSCSIVFCQTSTAAQDSDNDGVDDSVDKCPNTAQLKKLSPDFKYAVAVNPERLKPGSQAYPVNKDGCEYDADNDGVVNSQDYCPENTEIELSKGVADNGCPKHSDFDGTPDYRDKCPSTPRGVKTDKDGCPI